MYYPHQLRTCATLALALIAPGVFAQGAPYGSIHRCKAKNGTVVYQDSPCDLRTSRDLTIANWNNTDGHPHAFTGQTVTLNFHDTTLGSVLSLIADVASTTLYAYQNDELLATRGNFRYLNVPWDKALSEIADRYHLDVRFANGKMFVVTEENALYDRLVTKFEKQYPQLDPSSPAFDQRVLDHVKQVMRDFQRRNPNATPSEAVSYAVLTTLGH